MCFALSTRPTRGEIKAAMLLLVPMPADLAKRPNSSRCWRANVRHQRRRTSEDCSRPHGLSTRDRFGIQRSLRASGRMGERRLARPCCCYCTHTFPQASLGIQHVPSSILACTMHSPAAGQGERFPKIDAYASRSSALSSTCRCWSDGWMHSEMLAFRRAPTGLLAGAEKPMLIQQDASSNAPIRQVMRNPVMRVSAALEKLRVSQGG